MDDQQTTLASFVRETPELSTVLRIIESLTQTESCRVELRHDVGGGVGSRLIISSHGGGCSATFTLESHTGAMAQEALGGLN
jgi:hypothetical protein